MTLNHVATASLDLPVDSTTIRDAARMYARAGFAPVPVHGVTSAPDGPRCECGRGDCSAVGKHPVGGNWQKRASIDIDATRELFSAHSGNIGIVVGDRHVVIDIDDYAGGREGLATLPPMPPTLTSKSGSGKGEHRIFTLAPGQDPAEITNRKVAQGVDIKIRCGQIVAAPSLHVSGNRYQWIDTTPPAPLPSDLYERIRKRRVIPIRTTPAASTGAASDALRRRAERYMERIPGAVSGQGGHAQTFAAARSCHAWVAKGLDESAAWSLLVAFNTRCDPPWSDAELRHKFDDARKAEKVPIIEDRPPPGRTATSTTPIVDVDPPFSGPLPPTDIDWRSRLIFQRKKDGPDVPAKHLENAVVVLRYCPAWAGKVAWDEHSQRTIVTAPPWHESSAPAGATSDPVEWTDADTSRLSSWIRREVYGLDLAVADCDRAVTIAAEANPVHPFRDWLDSLRWDGTPRLADWLTVCLGVVRSPYVEAVGRWWLTAAVARTYLPGCKADNVLILEGGQGIRKSTALRTLVGERWFSDTPIDIGSKDAYLALQGRVVVELGELESLKRADADRAKVFFTSQIDAYRPPYGRRTIQVPRRCVFAGTVNHASYLTDDTGNRRYWPVTCGTIDLDFLASMRAQLWAEAVARYNSGAAWWPDGPAEHAMCAGEQAPRVLSDAWEDVIAAFVDNMDETTIGEVLDKALRIESGKQDRGAQTRAARILSGLGFARVRVRRLGRAIWAYTRKDAT